MKKATRSEEQGSQSHGQIITEPTLIAAVLEHLVFTASLNKYEAARELGDWSLHSTISSLANDYGITITRTKERVGKCRQPVTRYSIAGAARYHARDVLVTMGRKAKKVAA
ncbi:helix-turn-helix domain-containing protein [Pseudomonas paeninsulae]|uniref:helix-turn-helix domain-containing protein n=1 Tax=Pseudomonas paeninsulae TaxID=3110772 RepID=UPI002D79222B|nr:helix-turn-helix domain-containing protein [Pseudomonas sp. IT1137]